MVLASVLVWGGDSPATGWACVASLSLVALLYAAIYRDSGR